MMRTRRGNTLVEVLVALAVFSIITAALFASFVGISGFVRRQEQFARFDSICRDIAVYGDEYGAEWDKHYFGLETSRDEGVVYYDADFNPSETEQIFRLEYKYVNSELIVSVFEEDGGRAVIDQLNYGGARYVQTP